MSLLILCINFFAKEKSPHLCKDSSKGENSGHWESNPVYFGKLFLRAFSVRLCPDEPVLIPRPWGHKTRQTVRRIPLSLQLSSKSGGINLINARCRTYPWIPALQPPTGKSRRPSIFGGGNLFSDLPVYTITFPKRKNRKKRKNFMLFS